MVAGKGTYANPGRPSKAEKRAARKREGGSSHMGNPNNDGLSDVEHKSVTGGSKRIFEGRT